MISKQLVSKQLSNQIKSFTTISFVINATSLLEKCFWLLIVISGTLWIGDVALTQIDFWRENPTLITKGSKELYKLNTPTVTFCPNVMSEYTLAERLGNYMDPGKINSEEIILIRRKAIHSYLYRIYRDYDNCGYGDLGSRYKFKNLGDYQKACCGNDKNCKVQFLLCLLFM